MNELIIVTGGTGYIGSHTAVELMNAGYEVLILDNLSSHKSPGATTALRAIGAWFLMGRIGAASPQSGIGANLDTITAVVIGGTSLFGGRGVVIGTLLGAIIVGMARNGLSLAGFDPLWQDFTIGVLVIVAVTLDQWIRRVSV
mgnify:CR=1 FL=1